MLANVAKRVQPKKVCVLAHREELIIQNAEKIMKATKLDVSIERAESVGSRLSSTVVASVQTLVRRCEKWDPNHFGYIIVDEAHHIMAETYQKVIRHFSGAKVLGVTATPARSDKKELSQFFEDTAFEIGVFDLIDQGFLSEIMVHTVPLRIDLSQVKTVAGDYDDNALDETIAPHLATIAAHLRDYVGNRKTLVFLPLIKTSQAFVDLCRQNGISARHVDGNSPDRAEILSAFERGEFQVLSNASLLLEGYDCPSIESVIILRPTKSISLYQQMVGRGTRISPGKKDLLLLDFLYQFGKHGVCRPANLIATTEYHAEEMTRLTEKGGQWNLQQLDRHVFHEREKRLREQLEEASRQREAALVNAREYDMLKHYLGLNDYDPTYKWELDNPSEKQLTVLQKFGFNAGLVRSKGMASKLITTCIERMNTQMASVWDIKKLMRMGIDDPQTVTKDEARRLINERKHSLIRPLSCHPV